MFGATVTSLIKKKPLECKTLATVVILDWLQLRCSHCVKTC